VLANTGQPEQWSAELCRQWMQADPEATGVFYIDGHVRVYHGAQTALPRRYVSRQRLCLRATTDYWVNALDAQPFFVVTRAVDPGLVKVLEEEIVPRLERDTPQHLSQKFVDDSGPLPSPGDVGADICSEFPTRHTSLAVRYRP